MYQVLNLNLRISNDKLKQLISKMSTSAFQTKHTLLTTNRVWYFGLLQGVFLGVTLHTSEDHSVSIFHFIKHKLSLKC